MTPNLPRWLYPTIAILGAISLVSLSYRYRAEEQNKAVGIVAEFDTVKELAAGEGLPIDTAIERLKAVGLNGIVVNEQFLSDIVAAEQVEMAAVSDGFRLDGSVDVLRRIARGIMIRYPGANPTLMLPGSSGLANMTVGGLSASLVRRTPIGLDPADCSIAAPHGLLIVSRHINPSGSGAEYVSKTLAWAKELGSRIFLPQGDQVLGRRDAMGALVDTLRKLGMRYASAEFARIGGDQNVVEAAPDIVVRLHAAQALELDKLPLDEAVDRYVRAAKERNQRVLLIRPVTASAARGSMRAECTSRMKARSYPRLEENAKPIDLRNSFAR